MNRTLKRSLLATAFAAPAIVLAACSSSGTQSSGHSSGMPGMTGSTSGTSTMADPSGSARAGAPANGPHNQADVTFATDMIPHHGQAIEMAQLAAQKANSPEVKKLATAIRSAQGPEIERMSGWLSGWNEPVPDSSMGSMHGMSMPGMMSHADMVKLENASSTEFDKMWLTMMISHHQGAVGMAQTELSAGQNPDAKTLARSIISAQNKEIAQMKRLLPTIN